jgi:hypothetical protein
MVQCGGAKCGVQALALCCCSAYAFTQARLALKTAQKAMSAHGTRSYRGKGGHAPLGSPLSCPHPPSPMGSYSYSQSAPP